MKPRYYDLQHIKEIPIGDYLHACGIEPAKRYNGYALYHAPYREDHNASLKVDFRQNLWHDYGTNQGGSIIDLVMRMQGCSAYKAMAHLAERKATPFTSFSFHREAHIGQRRDEQQPNNTRRILSISETFAPASAKLSPRGTRDRPCRGKSLSPSYSLRSGRTRVLCHRLPKSRRRV